MGLFNRKRKDSSEESTDKKEPGAWRRPANTAFKQQRLKAWQPILTPKTVLPTLFLIALVFGPIGGLLVWGSSQVSEMTFDYTDCDTLTPSTSAESPSFVDLPKYEYRLRSSVANSVNPQRPQYAYIENSSASDVSKRKQCIIQFDVPTDLDHTVLLYYKLTNFYQNHRRYVKSLDSDQLKGKAVSISTLNKGNCKPLATIGGGGIPEKIIYPCGLVANSFFNDSFSDLRLVTITPDVTGYTFSNKGIAWKGEHKKYAAQTSYKLEDIVPPPNWMERYPNNYTADNLPPNLADNEHFQNWMRTAGLPTFTKLFGRNDNDKLVSGRYAITVDMNFPVRPYKGTKSFVISTVSWIGGKNPFLGWAYVAAAGVFVLLAIAGTARHLIRPRRLGDMSLLSWNQ